MDLHSKNLASMSFTSTFGVSRYQLCSFFDTFCLTLYDRSIAVSSCVLLVLQWLEGSWSQMLSPLRSISPMFDWCFVIDDMMNWSTTAQLRRKNSFLAVLGVQIPKSLDWFQGFFEGKPPKVFWRDRVGFCNRRWRNKDWTSRSSCRAPTWCDSWADVCPVAWWQFDSGWGDMARSYINIIAYDSLQLAILQSYIYIYIYIYLHSLHHIPFHFIPLHYTLHYIALHYIALHCITLHCITLHHTSSYIPYIQSIPPYIHT